MSRDTETPQPGPVVLFGSGETSASGSKIFQRLFSSLARPIRVAILETPAGFELNSAWVAGQVADFLHKRLQNFAPQVRVVPARKRGSAFSPDDPDIIAPLLSSNVIFMGAGSPTYAVRQLRDSLAWHTLVARQRLGASVVLASASTLAASAYTIPVYEIYKVGQDLHWKTGLDLFGPYNLALVFVPHWNNTDGGANLDTSRCYIGQLRFDDMLRMLPGAATVVGIEEHTALVIDIRAGTCQVLGRGGVVLDRGDGERRFDSGQTFAITELGPFRMPDLSTGIPAEVLTESLAAEVEPQARAAPKPSAQVLALTEQREAARARCDWGAADRLRDQISQLGWHVRDTPDGPQVLPLGK
jgi:cyanophycinase-like exopeptidase